MELGGQFCVTAFGRKLATDAVKTFSHIIYFITTFYKLCTFSAIYEDDAAINCFAVEHKTIRYRQLCRVTLC
jgi:hypothetical protein